MNSEERFVEVLAEELEILRLRLNTQLKELQRGLNKARETVETSPHYQGLYDLFERLDSARVHLYVAGEYLRGNGEWAFIKNIDEEDQVEFADQAGA
ncbi:MAG: hypothetical protein LBT16_03195 [Treponema sp.]|jgi:hypothetical protein|nr:hypothetical protein [Treponema sp.]